MNGLNSAKKTRNPIAPAGTPTDSEHAECGGVRRRTDSVLDFVEISIGAMRISSFLGLISSPFHRSGWTLVQLWGVPPRIAPMFYRGPFSTVAEKSTFIGETLEFFCGELGQGAVPKILSLKGLGGPRLAHLKFWPRPLKFWRNWGSTFLGWVRPGAPGAKMSGVGPKLKTSSAWGHPPVQNKGILGALRL